MSESDFTINFALETCIFEKLTNLANFEKFWDCVTLKANNIRRIKNAVRQSSEKVKMRRKLQRAAKKVKL